ncbi:hypothetical protein BU14_0715s0004 [Porphyra umbilicalis]|uniref:Uncharacterized protein n=1 Tax=Porphyra umbilicalis TaxID=2786 RepID=A0A1X6NPY6_PORUM|nr:hypothetical protein BU14_0715s0004 [Porphyra umbilicalis]|eukprot:OSX70590.1 hypothetical protein BU14_0715s0004 [Porphyra umbilicalis]
MPTNHLARILPAPSRPARALPTERCPHRRRVGRRPKRKRLARDDLVEHHVTAGELVDQVRGRLGQHRVLVRVARVGKPQPQKLLVDILRLRPGRHPRAVRGGDPVARRVGSVDLVNEPDGPVRVAPKLVLGVDEDQAALGGERLAAGKERERRVGARVRVRLGHEAEGDNVGRGNGHVPRIVLGRRRQHVGVELLVLDEALWEVEPAIVARARRVVLPQRRLRRARDVATHDKLDGEGLALAREQRVGVRRGDHVVGDNVLRDGKPVGGRQVEDLPLVRHRREDAVKRRLAVGRHEQQRLAVHDVRVADLAAARGDADAEVRLDHARPVRARPARRNLGQVRPRLRVGIVKEQAVAVGLLERPDLGRHRPVRDAEDLGGEQRRPRRVEDQRRRDARRHADRGVEVRPAKRVRVGRARNDRRGDGAVEHARQGVGAPGHGHVHLGPPVRLVGAEHRQQALGRLVGRGDVELRADAKLGQLLPNLLAAGEVRLGAHEHRHDGLLGAPVGGGHGDDARPRSGGHSGANRRRGAGTGDGGADKGTRRRPGAPPRPHRRRHEGGRRRQAAGNKRREGHGVDDGAAAKNKTEETRLGHTARARVQRQWRARAGTVPTVEYDGRRRQGLRREETCAGDAFGGPPLP